MEGDTVNQTSPDAVELVLADQPLDGADIALLSELRIAHERRDPVPQGLTDRIAFTLTVAALEAEVAELTTVEPDRVGVRASAPERADMITFSGSDLTAMVTLEDIADGQRRISGWASEAPLDIELRWATGVLTTTTDTEGRFAFETTPGLVHLVLRPADPDRQHPLITPLFEI